MLDIKLKSYYTFFITEVSIPIPPLSIATLNLSFSNHCSFPLITAGFYKIFFYFPTSPPSERKTIQCSTDLLLFYHMFTKERPRYCRNVLFRRKNPNLFSKIPTLLTFVTNS